MSTTDQLKKLLIQHFKIINEAIIQAGGSPPPQELQKLLDFVPPAAPPAAPPAPPAAKITAPPKITPAPPAPPAAKITAPPAAPPKITPAAATDSPSPTSSPYGEEFAAILARRRAKIEAEIAAKAAGK